MDITIQYKKLERLVKSINFEGINLLYNGTLLASYQDVEEKNSNSAQYKICPACSFFCSTKEPDVHCSLCGTKLILLCTNCSSVIDNPYAKFCKFCGNSYPGRIKEDKYKPF